MSANPGLLESRAAIEQRVSRETFHLSPLDRAHIRLELLKEQEPIRSNLALESFFAKDTYGGMKPYTQCRLFIDKEKYFSNQPTLKVTDLSIMCLKVISSPCTINQELLPFLRLDILKSTDSRVGIIRQLPTKSAGNRRFQPSQKHLAMPLGMEIDTVGLLREPTLVLVRPCD
ncbi:hypothetical protein Tco_0941457 [Tanacetum coccineum]|uniref:Uncharacterized protein n=1 Tax=Tanacetum coccineum TaxID=301880 RepID=A0ABQ5DR23_9ASTR